MPAFARYVILRNNQFEILKTEEDLRRTFAPIETADEALSYALAVKGLSAYYGLKRDELHEYYVDSLEDSHVTEAEDGYHIHLYSSDSPCDCASKTTSAVDLLITSEGILWEVGRTPVYRDIPTDQLCTN
jgi:hypothetical protein